MCLDASRPAIPAQSLRRKIAASAPPVVPAQRTRRALPEAFRRLAARQAAINSSKHPFAKIV